MYFCVEKKTRISVAREWWFNRSFNLTEVITFFIIILFIFDILFLTCVVIFANCEKRIKDIYLIITSLSRAGFEALPEIVP